ncbi:MAG: hypothetical protein MI749_06425 [Desulfovibrionales bacterium]|nr:hypothetical protein [Desulfovibrionales bacterium]
MDKKQIVVPKEKAVFWMDEHGYWHNEHGRFEHPKIIAHFHKSIRRDGDGYHVFQETDQVEEKVYFSHGPTAIFVFDIRFEHQGGILLILNTGTAIPLDPHLLFIQDDQLYCQTRDHLIRFTEKALLKLSNFLEETTTGLCFVQNGVTIPITTNN